MKILKRFSLLCIILILSQSIHNSIQQNTKNDDVPDDQLDPQDLKDYEAEKAEKLLTTTTPTTTTTTESTTTTTEEETSSPPTTTKSEETSTRVSTVSSSTSTRATIVAEDDEVKSSSPSLRVNEQGFIDFEVKSGKYQEIVVEKVASTAADSLVIYSIRSPLAALNNYQIQLNVDTDAHIDFRSCVISISTSKNVTSSENEECIRSYIEIVDSARFSLRIKRDQLPNLVRIKLRTVISGCNAESRIRDLSLASSTVLPSIYHNSDHECIYRVLNPHTRSSMMKLLLEAFPLNEDKVCHAIVEIANGDSLEDTESHNHRLQAKFDSFESIEPFDAGVLVAAKYAFIKVVNCYENNQPVEISIGAIRKASTVIILNEKRTSSRLDSDTVASPSHDSFLVAEVRNENLRNLIDYKIDYVLDAKKDCAKLDRNTSMLTVYGMDDLDNMHVVQYYPCSFDASQQQQQPVELNGFKTLYVQFYRDTKNPKSGLAADKFVLNLNLKVVQTKYIVLTNRANHVSSADFENLDLRNVYFDFEIRAPLGHRIVLNVSKFDNGKSTLGHQTMANCDDFLLVRLNKTTNRMKSFYETSHNPIFCSSIGTQPVLLSSYTNTLTVSIYLKQLAEGALNEEFIDFPHFEFSYKTEPFCDNLYTSRQNALISFSSLQSMPADSNRQCNNTISVGADRKVVLYKLDWLDYKLNVESEHERDETNLGYVNGRIACNGLDSLIISDENPKYGVQKSNEDDPNYIYNIYCMANPFRAYISDSSRLYMIYKLHESPVKPLVFDLGYFSYKYLYNDFDSRVDIDFSKIIPANISPRTVLNNLDVVIRLDNKTNYLVPVISECDFGGLETGDVVLKTSSRSIPVKNLKCGASEDGERTAVSYTTMLSMENELRVEFRNVRLSELREKKVRFRIDYTKEPRVFESNAATFETNNFKHDYVSITRDRVEYEWTIKVSANDMIRLRVDDLLNEAGITEWTITDLNENLRFYDQNELIKNFKSKRDFTYLIPTNWVKITFKHDRDGNKRRSTTTYPYVRLSYVSEPRIITQEQTSMTLRHELRLSNSLVKRRVEWVLVGARYHHIVAEIARFSAASKDSNGQIKFSLLGRGYTDNGTYHFNLNERREADTRDRVTDMVVSSGSALKIEYLPGQAGDSFTIAYRVLPQVRTEPSGWIRQYFNEITKPEVFVPRLTDQSWTIRAPYSKKIALYVKSLDLLSEAPCSKSKVDFYEANGTRVFSECGNMEPAIFELQHSLALITGSNELNVHFLTQNTHEVVYSGRIEESSRALGSDPLDTPADGESYHTYRGFLFFYAFVEQSGDCYFQQRGRNFMCGYESVAGPKWVIVGEADDPSETKSAEQLEFDKTFCSNCYLSAQIPVQSEAGVMAETTSILVSPVINKHNLVLRFDYRMMSQADLLVILIHNHDYMDKKFDRSVLIKKIDRVTKGNSWSTVRLRLGTHIMHNFRILFSLEQTNNKTSPSIHLDNIEFFENDYECAVRMDDDETCAAGSSILSSINQQSAKSPVNEVCQKYSTPCDLSECRNGALCLNKYQVEANLLVKMANQTDDEDEYLCVCPYGFTGKKCETRIDPCESNECSENSRCVGALGELERGYRCECNASFTGELCDERVSACKRLENPCNEKTEQGTCVDVGLNQHKCECSPLYTGETCETLLNTHCLNSDCNMFDPNATCIELSGQSFCRCSPGFAGPACTNVDDCKGVPCLNNATCIDGVNSFVCQCTEDFEGKYCEISKKCSKCMRQGTLYCKPAEARCVCRATHAGEHCEVELDPCLDNPCGKHGECISDKIKNSECLCNPGFKGKYCELEENVCDSGLCQNGATCMLAQDMTDSDKIGYECQCAPGFEGKNCELQTNMCEKHGELVCANGGTCLSTPAGKFTCLCPVTHTGQKCEQPIDHCLTAKCAHGSTCHIRLNSYICECPPGKFGRYCDEEQDPCLNNECKNGYCVPHDLQADGTHPYTCQCQPGYTGEHCEVEIDDCESSPCENNSTCVDLVGTYKCICPFNYRGKNCKDKVELCSLPETRCHLKNTKQCVPIQNGIKCDCLPRFTGLRCETPISFCEAFKPCRSGECVQLEGDEYECRNCKDGYGGKNCSELINYCDQLKPCQNDGVCYAKPNDYFCHCSEKFTGKNCEAKVLPECIHNRCMHNSLCIPDRDSKRGYKCECGVDHEGDYCEKKKDKCRDVNCAESGGYCVDGKCECDPKHPLCASECKKKNVVCMNGGKCVDVIKGSGIDAVCMCPPGLTGEFCEHSIFCVSNGMRPCGKNSQCKTVNQSYECHCEAPFIGHGCSIKLRDYLPEYENYVNQVRLSAQNEKCRFGRSKESKILIGIIAVGGFTLLIIGLMIGHCSIIAYRKRYEAASSLNKFPNKGAYSTMSSENSSTKSDFIPKTPIRALSPREMNLNKSSAFSIPRPSVRL